MFPFPVRQKIWPVCEAAHYTVDVGFGHRLQDYAAELVLQEPNLSAGLDPMLTSKLNWNYKLAF
jgi:hypothetical protein